jgi:hypothetical protein
MSEDEVKQIMRDAIDQNPEGTVWHVNTKHLVAFAQMVKSNAKTECKQREWVGLTDDEINSIEFPESGTATMRDFVRIIEAKLKDKNT